MYKRKIIYFLIFAIIITTALSGCTDNQQPTETLSKDSFMLGTFVVVTLYDHQNEEIIDKVFNRFDEIENRMSINIETSDVSKINDNAGIKPVKVHDDVYYVLKKAKEFAQISHGAFEPTIGPLVKLWGIGTEHERIPSEGEIEENLLKIDYNKLELMEDNMVYLSEPGMVLDLGGIAKGYAADEAKKILLENKVESAIIDLGGNIFAVGSKPNGDAWRIGIQDPYRVRQKHVGIVQDEDISVVTSGNYERYFEKDGVRYHHIIDSKTGYPARNNVAGISVLSDTSIQGDGLSTAFYVLGVEEGLKLANSLDEIEIIYITKDKKLYLSKGVKDKFEQTNEEFQIVTP
ncbi:FAD:protein FMN transferase [Sporosalibacterium faouarense]|uniref:FAD:protein FMN transferase n=1 Tax=Sporosalibacterium faouarense TaxID=516123 RepID=UPI00192B9127|nr:FAD:protein FMN transferase [Sporosalibacterium faouarense]